ncbi:MAG: hypothetical protein Q4G50_07440 [Corynebacterium sp.]|uniref:hypothetical protein n=1 Tax=Corynebacterium sp. TaxID=1720 RepID=UPI0026DF97F7|nr:hypothetical protein [Corynebacterium sp.]MDO5669821.1 hypothetical protein [Corynebacterium sp.]
MSYDWGIPQTQPAPVKKRRRGLIAVLALIVVAIVAAITFLVLPTVLRTPAGLSASQMRGAFQDGQLTDCDLGEEFYRTAGITNLSTGDDGCAGELPREGGAAQVIVITEKLEVIELLDATPSDPELTLWKQGQAPVFTQAAAETPAEPDMCTLAATDGPLRGVSIQTDANCEALYPLARHLINAARWIQSQEGFGRFNAFASLDLLNIPTPEVLPALVERDAAEFLYTADEPWWELEFNEGLCSFEDRAGEADYFMCGFRTPPSNAAEVEWTSNGTGPANVVVYEQGRGFDEEGHSGANIRGTSPTLLNPGEKVRFGDFLIERFADKHLRVTKEGESFERRDDLLTIRNAAGSDDNRAAGRDDRRDADEFVFIDNEDTTWWGVRHESMTCLFAERRRNPQRFEGCEFYLVDNTQSVSEGGLPPTDSNSLTYEEGEGFRQSVNRAETSFGTSAPTLGRGESVAIRGMLFEHSPNGEFRVTRGQDSFHVRDRILTINNT